MKCITYNAFSDYSLDNVILYKHVSYYFLDKNWKLTATAKLNCNVINSSTLSHTTGACPDGCVV